MVSLVNSHTKATSRRWHLWKIDFRFACGLPPGWPHSRLIEPPFQNLGSCTNRSMCSNFHSHSFDRVSTLTTSHQVPPGAAPPPATPWCFVFRVKHGQINYYTFSSFYSPSGYKRGARSGSTWCKRSSRGCASARRSPLSSKVILSPRN